MKGYYQSQYNKTSCTACSANHDTLNTGSTDSKDCKGLVIQHIALNITIYLGGSMSYLSHLCLFAYSGVQRILCCVFVLFSFVCVLYVASFSVLSFCYCPLTELQISCVFTFFTLWRRVKTHVLSDQSVHITHGSRTIAPRTIAPHNFFSVLYLVSDYLFLTLWTPLHYYTFTSKYTPI